jgi:hypothetical protein
MEFMLAGVLTTAEKSAPHCMVLLTTVPTTAVMDVCKSYGMSSAEATGASWLVPETPGVAVHAMRGPAVSFGCIWDDQAIVAVSMYSPGSVSHTTGPGPGSCFGSVLVDTALGNTTCGEVTTVEVGRSC